MDHWEIEAIDLLNQGVFQITDPGPLHAPINSFSINRNEDLTIILETELAPTAKSTVSQYRSDMVRICIDEVKIASPADSRAVLTGVQSIGLSGNLRPSRQETLKERAQVHHVWVTLNRSEEAAYIIEWLEDLPCSPFIWPDSIRTITETTTTHVIADREDGLTIANSRCPSGK